MKYEFQVDTQKKFIVKCNPDFNFYVDVDSRSLSSSCQDEKENEAGDVLLGLSDECFCESPLCLKGRYLHEGIQNPIGLRVVPYGSSWKPEQLCLVGKVLNVRPTAGQTFVDILWDTEYKPTLMNYTFLSKSEHKFKIISCSIGTSKHVKSMKNSDFESDLEVLSSSNSSPMAELEDITEEDEDKEIEDFLFLANPKSEIIDLPDDIIDVEDKKDPIKGVPLECPYCSSFPCRTGKYLTHFKSSNIMNIVKYIGKDDQFYGKTGRVEAYVEGDIIVRWLDDNNEERIPMFDHPNKSKPLIYFQFQFSCDKTLSDHHQKIFGFTLPREQEDLISFDRKKLNQFCSNCNSHPCKDGQFLLRMDDVCENMNLLFCGTKKKNLDNRNLTVKEKKSGYIKVDGMKENFYLTMPVHDSVGEAQFKFSCKDTTLKQTTQNPSPVAEQSSVKKGLFYSFCRIPSRTKEKVIHGDAGEKHSIAFTVDKTIQLCGIGLQLTSTPKKIIFTLLLKDNKSKMGAWNRTVFNQVFSDIGEAEMIKFKNPTKIEPGSEYLVMLSYYGGKSFVANGGKETVNVCIDKGAKVRFIFKDYQANLTTNVQQGVFGKFYFKVM